MNPRRRWLKFWRRWRVRAALYVDLDNVAGLAGHPERWLAWIESGAFDPEGRPRDVIVRRVYWNSQHERHRTAYRNLHFVVKLCRAEANNKKSTADLELALDAYADLLTDRRIDEFIILSGDSDFIAPIRRLRDADRSVVVYQGPHVVPALLDAADLAIRADEIASAARGDTPAPPPRGFLGRLMKRLATRPPPKFELDALAREIAVDMISRRATHLARARLEALIKRAPGFDATPGAPGSWLGLGGRDALIEAITSRVDELECYRDASGRAAIKLVDGVLRSRRPALQRLQRAKGAGPKMSPEPRIDLDAAAALVADAARAAAPAPLGRERVKAALSNLDAFVTNGRTAWLGLFSYPEMIKALADRREDLVLRGQPGGGAVLAHLSTQVSPETDIDAALAALGRGDLPIGLSALFERMAGETGVDLTDRALPGVRDRIDAVIAALRMAGFVIEAGAGEARVAAPKVAAEEAADKAAEAPRRSFFGRRKRKG